MYLTHLWDRAQCEIAAFDAGETLESNEKSQLRPHVVRAIWTVLCFEVHQEVVVLIVRGFKTLLLKYAVCLPAVAGIYLAWQKGEGTGLAAFAIGLLILICFLKLWCALSSLLLTERRARRAVLLLVLASVAGAMPAWLFSSGDTGLPSGVRYGLITGFGSISAAALLLGLLVAIPAFTQAFIWSLKMRFHTREEAIESINWTLFLSENYHCEVYDRDQRNELVGSLEWLSVIFGAYLPAELNARDPDTQGEVARASASIAQEMRRLATGITLATSADMNTVSGTLARYLIASSRGHWGTIVPRDTAPASPQLSAGRRSVKVLGPLLVAMGPLGFILAMQILQPDLGEGGDALMKTAFVPALGLCLSYLLDSLDPKSGERLTSGSSIANQLKAGGK
jgi:hypothetical protein